MVVRMLVEFLKCLSWPSNPFQKSPLTVPSCIIVWCVIKYVAAPIPVDPSAPLEYDEEGMRPITERAHKTIQQIIKYSLELRLLLLTPFFIIVSPPVVSFQCISWLWLLPCTYLVKEVSSLFSCIGASKILFHSSLSSFGVLSEY